MLQCRPFVAPQCTPAVSSAPTPLPSLSRLPTGPLAGRRRARCGSLCSLRRRRPGRASRPRPPVVRAEAASVRRRPVSSSHAPPFVVRAVGCLRRRHRRRRHRRQHSRSRVALPLWSFASLSDMFAAIGRGLSSCHRRPPPVAAVVVVDLSSPVVVLSHPAAGVADLGLGSSSSSGRSCARRRVVVVVVVGSCARRRRLAVFRWRGTPGGKHEGHPGTSDSSILQ